MPNDISTRRSVWRLWTECVGRANGDFQYGGAGSWCSRQIVAESSWILRILTVLHRICRFSTLQPCRRIRRILISFSGRQTPPRRSACQTELNNTSLFTEFLMMPSGVLKVWPAWWARPDKLFGLCSRFQSPAIWWFRAISLPAISKLQRPDHPVRGAFFICQIINSAWIL